MKAELLKIRLLPTPRNAVLAILAVLLLTCGITAVVDPDRGSEAWHRAPELAASITVTVGAMVLGAWMIGVEFASKTGRLAATVQPRRLKLVATKLVAAKLLLLGYLTATLALTFIAEAGMSRIGGSVLDSGKAAATLAGVGAVSLLWGLLAFGFALALRSYTGGVVTAIVVALGVDNGLQQIPRVGKYAFGSAAGSIANAISGDEATLGVGVALLTAIAWLLIVNGLGALRFTARDLK